MKVHFFGSLSGNSLGNGSKTNYSRIVEVAEKLGYKIVTKHYLAKSVEEVLKESEDKHGEYFKKMTKWIKSADVVIAEVTKPEIGTGYEAALAVNLGKPFIALYTEGQNSPIFLGQGRDKIQHREYKNDDLEAVVEECLEDAKEQVDVRFNFFVPPTIVNYLDWVAKKRRMPRAVYLRRLIEKDMDKDQEFKEEEE